jgi:hypothetical protein
MRRAFLAVGVCTIASSVASACMTRPVTSTEPQTSNLYVERIKNETIDKIDLLFMIDNSLSMGDKQKLFAKAVPQLVDRLVVPRCVNAAGEVRARASADEECPADFVPEFRAVRDIHVAVITSSLGSHGAAASSCNDPVRKPHGDDRGLLLPNVRPNLVSYNNTGFLAWDPDQKLVPPGEADSTKLGTEFGDMVRAAGEAGCGFEASLESWYRFLIDPEPPRKVTVGESGSTVLPGDIDTQVLEQRAAFLRPDSLVAIVMLTDENDCSIRDEASGHLLADNRKGVHMVRANSACAKDPNDPCCAPCQLSPLPNCPSVADDPACALGEHLTEAEDNPNLRCLENKRRFGYDFLYPTQRYIDGLTQDMVVRRSTGQLEENPLFKPGPNGARRSKSLIYLAGVVGVPWQDIADTASLTGPGLRYLSPLELSEQDRWKVIVGDRAANVPPSDPFMIESRAPRSGANPITGDAIVAATSLDPNANAINGHEQADMGDDLQFACTFRLDEPAPCTGQGCDCPADPKNPSGGDTTRNSPLCQPPGGGPAQATQYFGKAYPGLRPLEVLKGIGESAIVASICPKVLTVGEPGYGYEPAVDAIVDRLKTALTGRCLPRPLAVEASGGKLPCVVVEAQAQTPGAACSCDTARRSPASSEARSLVEKQLADRELCGTATTPACSTFCMCELAQAEGEGLEDCLQNEAGSDQPGYCYVHPYGDPPQGNPALVEGCGYGQPLLRFVGPNTPPTGANAFIACLGATVGR